MRAGLCGPVAWRPGGRVPQRPCVAQGRHGVANSSRPGGGLGAAAPGGWTAGVELSCGLTLDWMEDWCAVVHVLFEWCGGGLIGVGGGWWRYQVSE